MTKLTKKELMEPNEQTLARLDRFYTVNVARLSSFNKLPGLNTTHRIVLVYRSLYMSLVAAVKKLRLNKHVE